MHSGLRHFVDRQSASATIGSFLTLIFTQLWSLDIPFYLCRDDRTEIIVQNRWWSFVSLVGVKLFAQTNWLSSWIVDHLMEQRIVSRRDDANQMHSTKREKEKLRGWTKPMTASFSVWIKNSFPLQTEVTINQTGKTDSCSCCRSRRKVSDAGTKSRLMWKDDRPLMGQCIQNQILFTTRHNGSVRVAKHFIVGWTRNHCVWRTPTVGQVYDKERCPKLFPIHHLLKKPLSYAWLRSFKRKQSFQVWCPLICSLAGGCVLHGATRCSIVKVGCCYGCLLLEHRKYKKAFKSIS